MLHVVYTAAMYVNKGNPPITAFSKVILENRNMPEKYLFITE